MSPPASAYPSTPGTRCHCDERSTASRAAWSVRCEIEIHRSSASPSPLGGRAFVDDGLMAVAGGLVSGLEWVYGRFPTGAMSLRGPRQWRPCPIRLHHRPSLLATISESRRTDMPAFITLANFTDQGARAIKDSPDRF